MASPILRAVGDVYEMDALTMLQPVTEFASGLGMFRSVRELPLLTDWRSIRSVFALRRQSYDLVCVPAPAPRWQYAAVAWAVGGATTAIHRYGGLSDRIARAAKMVRVPLRGGHRSAENVRLLEALGLHCDDTSYLIPALWRSDQRHPLRLGLHTGSMNYKGNEQKRWPLERFAEIARRHLTKGLPVRAFFGPNEIGDSARLKEMVPDVEIVEKPLPEAASALSQCGVLVANDSGLAHLAAGLGVTTVVLFGMTDPVRCKPVGPTIALRPSPCPSCFDEGSRRFACVRNLNYRCLMDDMSVEYVEQAVEAAFRAPSPVASVEREGPLVLYGRVYTA
ncbi:MAG: glycosyltransferase family 9 protein [Candidatus Eremiobacteraeota bacterium]|nr:glycosyltransferase family 9 protein [Candidatus Eremiobacteraeota bacterium]